MTSIPLHYAEALVRGAVRAWWRYGRGRLSWAAAAGAGAAVAFVLRSDPAGGWAVTLSALVLIAAGVSAAAHLVPLRRSLRVVRAMDGGRTTLRLLDDAFEATAAAGSARVPWATVMDLVKAPDAWLLVTSRSSFSTLPLADLPPEARTFIEARVRLPLGPSPTLGGPREPSLHAEHRERRVGGRRGAEADGLTAAGREADRQDRRGVHDAGLDGRG